MRVTVIGSGTMGQGIAQVAATAGWYVHLSDVSAAVLEQARKNIQYYLNRHEAKGKIDKGSAASILQRITWAQPAGDVTGSDLVIEAVSEDLRVKQKLFQSLESNVASDTLFATNTSSLSVTAIASALQRPGNLLGIHFFNPAPLMPLVEIIPAEQTPGAVVNKAITWMTQWGKLPVQAKDTPGFIVNRIARPFYSEALRIYEEGLADFKTIDQAMIQYGGFRMGPFQLMDLIGNDVNYSVTETIWKASYFEPRYKPCSIQKRMIAAGRLGKKTGKGFYSYSGVDPTHSSSGQKIPSWIFDRILFMLVNEAAEAVYYKIASIPDVEKAMCFGAGYPKGLLKWANEIGIANVVNEMDDLFNTYHEERYRCNPLLRRMAKENSLFDLTF